MTDVRPAPESPIPRRSRHRVARLAQTHDWMNEISERFVAAHGVVIVTPVHWYMAPCPLKLMIDRLVCASGGNPDITTTHGKKAKEAKELELKGWSYPKHLEKRVYGLVVHGDVAGTEGSRRALSDWLDWMGLVDSGFQSRLDRYVGYYEPYATSHEGLDKNEDVQEETRVVARAVAAPPRRCARAISRPSSRTGDAEAEVNRRDRARRCACTVTMSISGRSCCARPALVREGRLGEATEAIRRELQDRAAPTAVGSAETIDLPAADTGVASPRPCAADRGRRSRTRNSCAAARRADRPPAGGARRTGRSCHRRHRRSPASPSPAPSPPPGRFVAGQFRSAKGARDYNLSFPRRPQASPATASSPRSRARSWFMRTAAAGPDDFERARA